MVDALAQQLACVLAGTLSADPRERSQAEGLLEQARSQPGYCAGLLAIASGSDVDLAVRQAASICLKNAVRRRWDLAADAHAEQPAKATIPAEEKAQVRSNLLGCILRSPRQVQKQLLEAAKVVALHDYPAQWQDVVPAALAGVASGDAQAALGSLLLLRRIAGTLEFQAEHAPALQDLASAVLPALLPLLRALNADARAEAALMARAILKILWSCLFLSCPVVLLADLTLAAAWLQTLLDVLHRPVPDALLAQPTAAAAAEAESAPAWKLGKWALRLAHRILARYGDVSVLRVDSAAPFADLFSRDFSLPFLKAILQRAEACARGAWAPRHTITYVCRYLGEAARQSRAQAALAPFLPDVLLHFALPVCYFTPALEEEWLTEPQEVIRRNSNALALVAADDLYDGRDAAASLLVEVLRRKPLRATLLDPVMARVVALMQEYTAAAGADCTHSDRRAAYRMDGACLALGLLLTSNILTGSRRYRGSLEALAASHVAPLFASPLPFLRAKAVWLAGCFAAEVRFADGADGKRSKGRGALFDHLFQLTLAAMKDPDLPVQVEAVNAFREFATALAEAGRLQAALTPLLPELLGHLFHLAGAVEAMDVIMSVDAIIEHLGDAIRPHAETVCRELVGVYARVVSEHEGGSGDEDVLFDASFHIMQPLLKLLEATAELPATFAALREQLLPLVEGICARGEEDVFDNVCEMLAYFTAFSNPIPDRVWALWPALERAVTSFGVEFCDTAVVPLEHLILRGTDRFFAAADYGASVLRMCRHCFAGSFEEQEIKHIAKLLDAMLLAGRAGQRADTLVWPALEAALPRARTATAPAFASLLVNALPAALVYNPAKALAALEAHDATTDAFELWFRMLMDGERRFFRRVYDKKLAALALTALLAAPALPPAVSSHMPLVFRELLAVLKALKEQEAAQRSDASGASGASTAGDIADASDRAVEGDDDADGGDATDEEGEGAEGYLEALRARRAEDDGSGGIDWDEWTSEADGGAGTPLDDEDAFAAFSATLCRLKEGLPDRFAALMASIDEGQERLLRELVQHAHIRSAVETSATGK